MVAGGHFAPVDALATHPTRAEFVTAGRDRLACVWALGRRACVCTARLPKAATCAAFHPDGCAVAIGLVENELCVLQVRAQASA